MAVEVRLRLRDPAEAERRRRPKEEPDAVAAETEDSSEETSSGDDQPARPFEENGLSARTRPSEYRFLIRLPIAQHGPELESRVIPGFCRARRRESTAGAAFVLPAAIVFQRPDGGESRFVPPRPVAEDRPKMILAKKLFQNVAPPPSAGRIARHRRGRRCCTRGRQRGGIVLILVTVVIVMVSLAGLSFVLTLTTEHKAIDVNGDELRLRQLLESGVELLGTLAEQSPELQRAAGGGQSNPDLFRGCAGA